MLLDLWLHFPRTRYFQHRNPHLHFKFLFSSFLFWKKMLYSRFVQCISIQIRWFFSIGLVAASLCNDTCDQWGLWLIPIISHGASTCTPASCNFDEAWLTVPLTIYCKVSLPLHSPLSHYPGADNSCPHGLLMLELRLFQNLRKPMWITILWCEIICPRKRDDNMCSRFFLDLSLLLAIFM